MQTSVRFPSPICLSGAEQRKKKQHGIVLMTALVVALHAVKIGK